MSYLMDLQQHYREVRARLDGKHFVKPIIEPVVEEEPDPEPIIEAGPEPVFTVMWVDPLSNVPAPPEVKRMILDILEKHQMSWQEAVGRRKRKEHIAVRTDLYLMLLERGWSYPRIGRLCGKRDHTTVLHSVKTHRAKLAQTGDQDAGSTN